MSKRQDSSEPDSVRESPGVYRTRSIPSTGAHSVPHAKAKLFRNGRSQAVRLPKAFRLPGREVHVYREGNRVVLEPIDTPERDANGWPVGLWDRLAELRDQVTDADFELPPDPPPPADEFDSLPGDGSEET